MALRRTVMGIRSINAEMGMAVMGVKTLVREDVKGDTSIFVQDRGHDM